jgi:hypothetical protein
MAITIFCKTLQRINRRVEKSILGVGPRDFARTGRENELVRIDLQLRAWALFPIDET